MNNCNSNFAQLRQVLESSIFSFQNKGGTLLQVKMKLLTQNLN